LNTEGSIRGADIETVNREEYRVMTNEDRNVTPTEFIHLLERAVYWTRYNGFTKEELKLIYAKATTLREACEMSFDELELVDIDARFDRTEIMAGRVKQDVIQNFVAEKTELPF
jgi:hypothetical protein